MKYELGGDRAVIIVSALVAILSTSTSVSKEKCKRGKKKGRKKEVGSARD